MTFELVFAIIFGVAAILPDALAPHGRDGTIELSGDELINDEDVRS